MSLTALAAIAYSVADCPEIDINGLKLRKLNVGEVFHFTSGDALKQYNVDSAGFANGVDTTRQTILFFGDSMTEGLFYRLDDYCHENKHTLYSLTWYSASTQTFAASNILETYIRCYHPTYYIICLGSNELFVRDLPERRKYIATIIKKLGGKPYVWISPPNWKKDTGMDSLISNIVGSGRFFNSSRLNLSRSSDHIHPTAKASAVWMDSIAVWLGTKGRAAHPIIMDVPRKNYHHSFTDYYEPDFKGFVGDDTPERHRRFF